MNDEAVTVFATFHPQAGKRDELVELLQNMIDNTRQEEGNQVYDLYSSGDEGQSLHLFERYRDQAALDAHRAADYYKAYRGRLPELLDGQVSVVVLNEIDARGAS